MRRADAARADALAAGPILAAGVSAASARIDGTWTELNVFVAVDLVELDGQSLVDVPYQERRRLLESVVREGEGLRLSPIVKHPVSAWLTGWREAGFTHYLARHQNSRYLAGEQQRGRARAADSARCADGHHRRPRRPTRSHAAHPRLTRVRWAAGQSSGDD